MTDCKQAHPDGIILSIDQLSLAFRVWDRAQWHKSRLMCEYLSQYPHIETFHFPPGCPQLHPQEHVGERTRDAVSHNHTSQAFSALVQAFRFHWIDKYLPRTWLAVLLVCPEERS
jgi:hypothetical protein